MNIALQTPATPDVTGLSPEQQHATVLAALDHMIDGYRLAFGGDPEFAATRAHQSITGRRAILERHQPRQGRIAFLDTGQTATVDTRLCREHSPTGRLGIWPCPDYINAAAGLVDGLPPEQP